MTPTIGTRRSAGSQSTLVSTIATGNLRWYGCLGMLSTSPKIRTSRYANCTVVVIDRCARAVANRTDMNEAIPGFSAHDVALVARGVLDVAEAGDLARPDIVGSDWLLTIVAEALFAEADDRRRFAPSPVPPHGLSLHDKHEECLFRGHGLLGHDAVRVDHRRVDLLSKSGHPIGIRQQQLVDQPSSTPVGPLHLQTPACHEAQDAVVLASAVVPPRRERVFTLVFRAALGAPAASKTRLAVEQQDLTSDAAARALQRHVLCATAALAHDRDLADERCARVLRKDEHTHARARGDGRPDGRHDIGDIQHPHPGRAQLSAVRRLKSLSARYMFRRFPYLRRGFWSDELWSPSYFVRTVGDRVTAEMVKRYIDTHDERAALGPVQAELFPKGKAKRSSPPRAWGRLIRCAVANNVMSAHPHVRGDDFTTSASAVCLPGSPAS